jgi:HAMP domain-containing protein
MTFSEHLAVKISFALLVAVAIGILSYACLRVAGNGSRLNQIRKEIADGNPAGKPAKGLDLPVAQQAVESLSAEAFMTAENQAEFLSFLKEAPGDGVTASVHLSLREAGPDGLIKIPMRLDVSTDFPRVVRYLSRLERSGHYFFVQSVKTSQPALKDSATTTAATTVDASIDGYVYWR